MRFRHPVAVVLLVVSSLVAVAAPAAADPTTAEEARALYERGLAAFALSDFVNAAAFYEKAFSLKPDPALLYNAAQSHRLAGNKERSLSLYQNYLRFFGAQVKNRDEVNRHIGDLKAAIASDRKLLGSPPLTTAQPRDPGRTEPSRTTTRTEPPATRTEPPATKSEPAPVVTRSEPPPAKSEPESKRAPAPAAAVTAPPAAVETREAKPRRSNGVLIGVFAGAAVVVVGGAVGIGLGVGLGGQATDPVPTFGATKVQ